MDREQLREAQAPLKERYRADPGAALVTLHAEGELAPDDVVCRVQTPLGTTIAGLHPATGGDGSLACSGDMLLQALVACAGVTLRSIATVRGIALSGRVHAEGDIDFRGTLGVERAAPVGFSAIRLTFEVDTDADDRTLNAVMAGTERYCVVYQTLLNAPEITVSTRRVSADGPAFSGARR